MPEAIKDERAQCSAQPCNAWRGKSLMGPRNDRPAVIVLGGFAGAGKTTLARRLSSDLGIPVLGSDTIGRIISTSKGLHGGAVDAYWIAYDVVFGLCEAYLQSGVSTILDLNMGWTFQWQQLDAIRQRHPDMLLLPIILRCPLEVCLERIHRRHAENPAVYGPPELFTTNPKIQSVWTFLDRLERSDVVIVDAARSQDEVYEEIRQRLARSSNRQ